MNRETERGCSAISETTWEELEKEIFTPEEIAESDRRVAEMLEAPRNGCETRENRGDAACKC